MQAPQDHRDWRGDRFKEMLNWEYAGFFDIGMCLRNEYDAIIQHGTMTLVRRDLHGGAGRLGDLVHHRGHRARPAPDGEGLRRHVQPRALRPRPDARPFRRLQEAALPLGLRRHADHEGACRQDAQQHDQAHLLAEVPLRRRLDAVVRRCAEPDLHLGRAGLGCWPCSLPPLFGIKPVGLPPAEFILPTIGIFVFKLLYSFGLYFDRVRCTFRQSVGASLAGLALTYTVGRAVIYGLATSRLPFMRTPKMDERATLGMALGMARGEAVLDDPAVAGRRRAVAGDGRDRSRGAAVVASSWSCSRCPTPPPSMCRWSMRSSRCATRGRVFEAHRDPCRRDLPCNPRSKIRRFSSRHATFVCKRPDVGRRAVG